MLFSSSPKHSLSSNAFFVVPTQEGPAQRAGGISSHITGVLFSSSPKHSLSSKALFVVPTQEGPAHRAGGIASHITKMLFSSSPKHSLSPKTLFVVPTLSLSSRRRRDLFIAQEGPAIQLPTTQIFVPQHNKNNVFHFMQKGAV